MNLREYIRKRDFKITPEPKGKVKTSRVKSLYVIQKHAASHLHYDFRLELKGVLVSWAIPKGPSLNPSEKRLAVQVEDHPVDYGNFEGSIPQGEYGGGTVMLWDHGEWEPVGDAEKSYQQGKLSFYLHGKKLRGLWKLFRVGGKMGVTSKNWLLVKQKDDEASASIDITEHSKVRVQ